MWVVRRGGWHGWGDFASGLPVTNPRFQPEGMPAPEFLLAEHPPLAGQPRARLAPHSGSVRLNPATGQVLDFYVSLRPGRGGTGPERPIALKFAPDGDAMYLLDFGLLETFPMTMVPKAGTGALWRVTREA